MTNNQILATTKLSRAYVAVERGEHDVAMAFIRDAATYAWLDGDYSKHQACVKARAIVARVAGKSHLSVVA